MSKWEKWPDWPELEKVNQGVEYKALDGISADDLNVIVQAAQCLKGPAARFEPPALVYTEPTFREFYIRNPEGNADLGDKIYLYAFKSTTGEWEMVKQYTIVPGRGQYYHFDEEDPAAEWQEVYATVAPNRILESLPSQTIYPY